MTQTPIQRIYAKNADDLQRLLEKAERMGTNVNGYTADELRQSVADYRALAITGIVPPIVRRVS